MAATRKLGNYRIIAELGRGGMSDVYLAMVGGPAGSGFTKLAVVKRLRPNLVEDPDFVAMLVDEGRISARLNHPNVVQTHEVGVEGEEYYLAMEFLDGQPLHRIQRRAERTGLVVPRELAYLVIVDMLAGLHHAHELPDYDGSPLGIVHRDINPQNVFVTYGGLVKVVDFGIAKASGRACETQQGIVKGKVRYMSPEQAIGQDIDRRSDVFAAGLMLWEAATGKRFWRDQDDLAIVQTLIAGGFDTSPRSVDLTVPFAIDAICRKALAVDPQDRHATAAELRDELEAFLAGGIVAARRRLGPFVAQLFEKERAMLRSVVQNASRGVELPCVAAMIAQSASMPAVTEKLPLPAPLPSLSLMPLVLSASEPPLASMIEARSPRRFGSAAVVAAMALLAASMLFVVGFEGSGIHVGFAGPPLASRIAARPGGGRTMLALRSTAHKARPAATHAAPLPVANIASAPAPSPVAPIAIVAPVTPPSGPHLEPTRHRSKPALDTGDPWSVASPTALNR